MAKIPRKILALFGEFMHEFNLVDLKCKSILVDLMDDQLFGHMLVMHQSIEFVIKRLDVVYREIIDDDRLTKRWKALYPEIRRYQEIRNDIAHSHCDVNPDDKREFVLTRFSEKKALEFSQRTEFYTVDDLASNISKLKKLNIRLKNLFHSTFISYTGAVYVRPKK